MKRTALSLIVAFTLQSAFSNICQAAKKEPAPPKKVEVKKPVNVDKYTGEYTGSLVVNGKKGDGLAQVIAEPKGQYRAVLMRGLWKTAKDAKQIRIELTGKIDADGNVPLEGKGWKGTLIGRKTLIAKSDKGSFEGKWTVRKFGSVKLHIEFRCPYEPNRRGQGRGNSGVYLQKRYEVQVLPGKTTAAAASGLTPKDSLMLQDHGNKVEYRNVWIVEK